jgi:hypothetical protein
MAAVGQSISFPNGGSRLFRGTQTAGRLRAIVRLAQQPSQAVWLARRVNKTGSGDDDPTLIEGFGDPIEL